MKELPAIIVLKQALINWRRCEIQLARAVLSATHPDYIEPLQKELDHATDELRKIVDSEPWAAIARGD
jgi:hypothetical protein